MFLISVATLGVEWYIILTYWRSLIVGVVLKRSEVYLIIDE